MACALVDATSEQFKQKILQQHQNRSVDRRCAPTEQTNMNRHVRNPPQSTQDWLGDFRNPLCSWNLVSLEPCLPGTLVSGTLAQPTAYIGTLGFRNRDALIYCHAVPPCQRLLVDRALLVLETWFPCKLVFWDPVRSMNLGTTHGVYPTPGLFPEPRNLARTLTLSLSGTCGIIQEVYPNCGSASVVVLGTLSEPSVAGTLPESWFPKLWVCRMFQNWCSGDSRTLAQSRLWLLETMVRFPEPCRKPSVPGTFPEP